MKKFEQVKKGILIAEGFSQGGLKTATQHYWIYYLSENEFEGNTYPPKISIEHRIEPVGEEDRFKALSIRFNNPEQLMIMIDELITAFFLFKKKTNQINVENFPYIVHKIKLQIDTTAKEVMKNN